LANLVTLSARVIKIRLEAKKIDSIRRKTWSAENTEGEEEEEMEEGM
jgi:hypothetical protein